MFKLSRRQSILRVSLLGVLITAVLSTAVYFIINQHQESNASTKTGDWVTIQKGKRTYYADYHTHKYKVQTPAETHLHTYTGYCAEPTKDGPDDDTNKKATLLSGGKYDLIKLLIYLKQTQDPNAATAQNNIFGLIDNDGSWSKQTDDETPAERLEIRRYNFTHAVIGIIYGGDDHGLDGVDMQQINAARNRLQTLINSSDYSWQQAQKYNLFYANKKSTETVDQDIVWIEPTGSITVQKCDSQLSGCGVQGNANFDGISFTLYNGSTPIATKTLTGGAKSVSFDHLDIDITYTIKESGSNNYYNLTASDQTATPTLAGTTVTFRNTIKKGDITVNKIDAETGTCTTLDELSFNGVTFQLLNISPNPIFYNGNAYNTNQVIATKTLSDSDCSATFTQLPYGLYVVKETATGQGYELDSSPHDIALASNSASITIANRPIRGDVKFVKMDPANNMPKSNMVFSISALDKNQNIKETHIVVSDQNGVVDTSSSFIPHTFHTNGYDELYDSIEDPIVYLGYGTWFGKDKNGNSVQARDNVGALPYGKYIIQELRCDANMFCTNIINQKVTINITQQNQVVDLGDWDNTCAKFTIETEATDNKDGDKIIEVTNEPVEIKDTVSYCAKKNYNFTIKGILMDKETGNPIKVNGKNIEQSMEVKPEADCGTVEMIYKLDAKDLAGKEVVVFESLYYRDSLMTSHEEIDDESQTVELISLTTYATNDSTGEKVLPLDSDVRIKDNVRYCLKPGVEYTVKGVVMDKRTGNGLLINSKPIEQSVTFTPKTACGEFDMFYDLNTTNLGGAELVIFESLYRNDELLLEHRNINNIDETVTVELPVPETGASTKTPNASQESSNYNTIIIIATSSIVVYMTIRFTAKKRFFKR